MYINKCTKCGADFETKNPKRVICPNCLYSEKKSSENGEGGETSYSGGDYQRPEQPQVRTYNSERNQYNENVMRSYNGNASYRASYNNDRSGSNYNNGYNRNYDGQRSYNSGYNRYERPNYDRNYEGRSYDRGNGGERQSYDRPQYRQYNQYGNNRPQQRPYQNNNRGGNFRKPMQRRNAPKKPAKQLLITKEQLAQIEILYKKALPLPNHDIHEVIGTALGIEPRKVFFGINLIRQKMMLPKLSFPKRKLAVTADQLNAIKLLYEPLLPTPPIGCHKIIAIQLKMDEWRVHVGIGLLRKQMGLDRWNQDRPDIPEEFKVQNSEENKVVEEVVNEEKPKKRTTKSTKAKENDAEPEKTVKTVKAVKTRKKAEQAE